MKQKALDWAFFILNIYFYRYLHYNNTTTIRLVHNMTHNFFFGNGTNDTAMHGKHVAVYESSHGCDGERMWLDSDGQSVGWAKKDGTPNSRGSFVKKKRK